MDTSSSTEHQDDKHYDKIQPIHQSHKRSASETRVWSPDEHDLGSSSHEVLPNKHSRHKESPSPSSAIYTGRSAQLIPKNDGNVPAYNSRTEALPTIGPYSSSFALAEMAVPRACNIFIEKCQQLKNDGYVNMEIDVACGDTHLGDSGLAQCRIPSNFYPAIKPVVVLGPAGSGKSSALNSLMDQAQTAYAHDGEDRGTHVVHEFRSAHHLQTSRYMVEVLFYTDKEMKEQVGKMLDEILRHLFPDKEQDFDEEDGDSLSMQKYQTAIGFFCDIFADREEFQTEKQTIEYFDAMDLDTQTEVLTVLLRYLQELLNSRSLDADCKEYHTAENGSELQAILKSVARPSKRQHLDRKPCPWPLIRKVIVRQGLRVHDLGVILADTPGTNDTDLIITANTRGYLKQAGTVLIFLPYKRISKNPALGELLRTCITLGKMHNMRLVVTMIDEMNSLDEDTKDGLSASERASLYQAESRVKESTDEIGRIKADQDEARGRGNSDLFMQLDDQLKDLVLQLEAAKAAVKQTTIKIRCDYIKRELRDSIKDIEGSRNCPELPVHFVSNKIYKQHLAGYKQDKPPDLTVEATGIPELRRYILTIPALGKLEKLTGLVKNRLLSSFSGIDGILTKSTLERKTEVRAILMSSLNSKNNPMSYIIEEVRSAFKEEVIATIKECKPQWCEEIEQKLFPKWEAIHAQTFQGLCSRYGDWQHKKLGYLQLNAEIVSVFAPKLIKAFNGYDDRVSAIEWDIKKNVADYFENVQNEVDKSPAAAGQDLARFFEFIKRSGQTAIAELSTASDEFIDKVAHIRHYATLDTEESYQRVAMNAVYDTCASINARNYQGYTKGASSINKPKGKAVVPKRGKRRTHKKSPVTSARLQTMHNKTWGQSDESSIFDDVGRAASDDLDKALGEYKTKCDKIVHDVQIGIIKDFERRFKEPEVKAEDNPEAVSQLKEAAKEAMEILNGPVRRHLEQCYKHEGRVLPE